MAVNRRRSRNHMNALQKPDGDWTDDPQHLKDIVTSYFTNLFSYDPMNEDKVRNCSDFITKANLPQISDAQAHLLNSPITKLEIETAVFQMEGNKAPGPDGFPPSFFQTMWPTIQNDIYAMVASFFNRGYLLKELNRTNVVLIPKDQNPCSPKDFRPISLCNVTYRIISKVLANKLQPLMSSLVTKHQNAFVKGRCISDNIILTGEILHHIKKQKRSKSFWAALKVDYFKAFDRIRWDFLIQVLHHLNFPAKWITLIQQCISTTLLQIMINGSPTDPIKPQCGLRQGDPLSPYLFLLWLNVLSHHLQMQQNNSAIVGVKIVQQGPRVNHLFFTDDSVLFFKANINSCTVVKLLLDDFALYSGLSMNSSKSQVSFSPNTPARFMKLMSKSLKCKVSPSIGLYLGCILDGGISTKHNFNRILDTLQSRLEGWQGRFLSKAGRITLIKSTLFSISTYYLSHMSLSKSQASKCDSIINNFLWLRDKESCT